MAIKNLGKVVPQKGVDYFTEQDIKSLNIPTKTSQLTNDSNYVNKNYVDNVINNIEVSGGSGLTTAQINSLNNLFKVCAFVKADVSEEYNAFLNAFSLGGSGDEEGEEEPDIQEVTLVSISATYNGGEVEAGTNINSLTGINVKATYSDGSTKNVTDYTMSGTIKEGNNTITISYEGKTTTIIVVGYVEEEPEIPSGGNTEVVLTMLSNDYTTPTAYTDAGVTTYAGKITGSGSGTTWVSNEVFDKDTVVTISVLYGVTNANLTQHAGCVGANTTNPAYYVEKIGNAKANEYQYTYTVRAGYRLLIMNYNPGNPQSIKVMK